MVNYIRRNFGLPLMIAVSIYLNIVGPRDYWTGFLTACSACSLIYVILGAWEAQTRKRLRRDHPA